MVATIPMASSSIGLDDTQTWVGLILSLVFDADIERRWFGESCVLDEEWVGSLMSLAYCCAEDTFGRDGLVGDAGVASPTHLECVSDARCELHGGASGSMSVDLRSDNTAIGARGSLNEDWQAYSDRRCYGVRSGADAVFKELQLVGVTHAAI